MTCREALDKESFFSIVASKESQKFNIKLSKFDKANKDSTNELSNWRKGPNFTMFLYACKVSIPHYFCISLWKGSPTITK
jgi:hypothetical protein